MGAPLNHPFYAILIGFSTINHQAIGVPPIHGNLHINGMVPYKLVCKPH